MQVSIKGRILALGTLLVIYLAAVLLLSAVTLYEPRTGSTGAQFHQNKDSRIDNSQSSKKSAVYSGNGGLNAQNNVVPGDYSRVQALRPSIRRARLAWCSQLTYVVPSRQITALASFPGSGNTWLRYLLQQATGFYTGSVYKDYGLLKNGFPAENVNNGSVIVVKTHEWGQKARSHFQKAVLLVRAPAQAMQAEFNRQSGGHVGFASPERYKRTKGKYWQQFVSDNLKGWRNMNLDWFKNFTGPLHVIFYDKLVEDTEGQLKDLLKFLEIEVHPEKFRCAIDRKEGIFRRRKKILNFDPFTDQMKKIIKEEQEKVYNEILETIIIKHR